VERTISRIVRAVLKRIEPRDPEQLIGKLANAAIDGLVGQLGTIAELGSECLKSLIEIGLDFSE